jgi:hypothetical protein
LSLAFGWLHHKNEPLSSIGFEIYPTITDITGKVDDWMGIQAPMSYATLW